MTVHTPAPAAADTRKAVILTVDDDPNNLSVIRDCLAGCNYTILVAEDGESAVKRADYARPDLILLDVMMPGIDGFETCRRLKGLESTREIPVIFMTALAEAGHKVKGLAAGGVDYITKPFHREELLARIAIHLHNRVLTRMLLEANELLETRVQERTAELDQAIKSLHEEIIEREKGEEERIRLATAIEQGAEAIFMTDAQWCITYANPAFERINGYAREEVLGRNTRLLKSGVHDGEFFRHMRETVRRDDVWTGRITTRRKDGTTYEADTTISAVRDKRGDIINYVTIHRDVSRELRLERELRQSQKMEAIGTLAGGIAHDFNNILMAIIGYTELAQHKLAVDHAATPHLERVQEASSRARELVHRILTFSRQSEQERKPVIMAPMIEEVLKLLRSTLPSTIEIHKHVTTPPGSDTVLADPTQIHQVLMNLGTNAAHAMRSRGGALSVSLSNITVDASLVALYPDLSPGPFIRLTVSDTGHGMEPHILERIFDPYFTTKKVGEGTGMGLAVVQGIIKSHGGAISVYSEPGQGTTFHIFLPQQVEYGEFATIIEEAPGGGTERILFVDDEAILTELGQELLETLGYTVTAVSDSCEALERFRVAPHSFDLVITDLTMPGLTGKELASQLLAIRADIPVILCTGFSEQTNEEQARECGVREYVMKPYSSASLNKTIRKILATP